MSSNISKYNYSLLSSKYDFKNRDQNILNYVKYMLIRTSAMFKYSNLPPELSTSIIENILQSSGKALITRINNKIYALRGEGRDRHLSPYDLPVFFHVTNNALDINESFKIGEKCVLMKGDTLEIGLLPMLNKYCTQLADNDITISMCNINSRLQAYISATDENTRQSAEKFLKDLSDGKLGVISENKIFDSLKIEQVKTSNSYQQLIELQQYIKASMYNELGLSANYNMKRERLSSAEVESNTDNLYPLVDDMLYCREQALLQINEMFNTNITVDFNSSWRLRIDTVGDVRDGKNAEKTGEKAGDAGDGGYADEAGESTVAGAAEAAGVGRVAADAQDANGAGNGAEKGLAKNTEETRNGIGQNADKSKLANNVIEAGEAGGVTDAKSATNSIVDVSDVESAGNDPELKTKKTQNDESGSDTSSPRNRQVAEDEKDDNQTYDTVERKQHDTIKNVKKTDHTDDKKIGDNTSAYDVSNSDTHHHNTQSSRESANANEQDSSTYTSKNGASTDGNGQDNHTNDKQQKNDDSKSETKTNKSKKKKSHEKEER